MVGIARDAVADDAVQLRAQVREAAGRVDEFVETELAYLGILERDDLAPMPVVTQAVEADQLARKMEREDLLVAIARNRRGLERAGTRYEQALHRIAHAEQAVARREQAPPPHDAFEPVLFDRVDACGKAGLAYRKRAAPLSEVVGHCRDRRLHGPHVAMPAINAS
ncbi:MAG TPA: hypothetical protein VFE72_03730 [Lysobacter sp.]|nr:hypothetical protein [Lysobacter sp.]